MKPVDRPRRPLLLPAWGTAILLGLGLMSAEPAWLATLRGVGPIESEMRHARAEGYYESLLREPIGSEDRHAGKRELTATPRPPAGWKTFADSGLAAESPDYLRKRLHPNRDASWNGKRFRTNSLGYRGPEVALTMPPGTFRVVVLGSSNTLGHGVDDEAAYPRRLERWLAERAGPDRSIEVINLAVSGDSPTQRLARLRAETARLQPDWLFCDATALDLSLEELHLRWVVENRPDIPFDYVSDAIRDSAVAEADAPDEFHRKIRPHLRPLLDRTFEGWAAEASRIGVPLTVVILPRADAKAESPELFRMLRDLAARHGLGPIDLSTTFDHLALEEYRIAPWDHHPNEQAHQLLFERLRRALLDFENFTAALPARPERVSGF